MIRRGPSSKPRRPASAGAMAAVCLFGVSAMLGCGGAEAGAGLDLSLRVRGAQLVRGAMPAANGGPSVTQVDVNNSRVFAGDAEVPFTGRTTGDGYAVNLAIEGDKGYWIRSVTVADDAVPSELRWTALLDFTRALAPGPFKLLIQAADADGRFGVPLAVDLVAQDTTPAGELVITLEWDQPMDVDLVVQDPAGVVLSPKNISAFAQPGPGQPQAAPDAWKTAAYLDADSNAQCLLDGQNRENAIWPQTPRPGKYLVFAALSYGCNQQQTAFRVTARRAGEVLRQAAGTLYLEDGRSSVENPNASPGLLVMELDL